MTITKHRYACGIVLFDWDPKYRTLTSSRSKLGISSHMTYTDLEIIVLGKGKDALFEFGVSQWCRIFRNYLDRNYLDQPFNLKDDSHGIRIFINED